MLGRIYMLTCNVTGLQYIGSTIQSLRERLRKHKQNYIEFLNGKFDHELSSFEILKCNDYYIELIEEIEIDIRQDLYDIENIYIQNIKCVNKYIAPSGLSKKEKDHQYYVEHKKKYNERSKQYRIDNKEFITEQKKKKYTCECGSTLTTSHKSRHEKTKNHQEYLKNKKYI